jgi:hypothetical protein
LYHAYLSIDNQFQKERPTVNVGLLNVQGNKVAMQQTCYFVTLLLCLPCLDTLYREEIVDVGAISALPNLPSCKLDLSYPGYQTHLA